MPPLPTALPLALPEAPGAKAARVCGLLAIIAALTCLGIPVALVLGIVALVQHAKAKRLAGDFPQEYRPPTSSGLAMGIVGLVLPLLMLPILGMVTAFSVPAYLAFRDRAKDKQVMLLLEAKMPPLVAEYQKGKEVGLDPVAIQASLESVLQASPERNPLQPQAPAYRPLLTVVTASSPEEAQQSAQAEAVTPGEIVFVVAFPPEPGQPGYLAGAAALKMPVNGSLQTSRVESLD